MPDGAERLGMTDRDLARLGMTVDLPIGGGAAAGGLPTTQLWYDTKGGGLSAAGVFGRAARVGYTGAVLYPETLDEALPHLGSRLTAVVHVDDAGTVAALLADPRLAPVREGGRLVIASSDDAALGAARKAKAPTCLRAYIDDGASLHGAIARGQRHDYLALRFRDPTNIPLELVIASLQATDTVLVKEINGADDVDDAVVTLGVMECGADGVMFSPREHRHLDAFLSRLAAGRASSVVLATARIVRSEPVGMGYRSCIDLATLFQPTEGLIVGSTSQGGILCCPEVFYLPYMELRPFRVNAGAVHSYVYNFGDRTDYMSELKAGAGVMVVGLDGRTRRAAVGRMKTEVRPLRLIEAAFSGGETVNVLMQDDWHVRVFSAAGTPLNVTALKAGDEVLAHLARPGRHVGIKVEETILET
jgi:3-dehydroquinate synthase II/3-amino-4-hydroxybenzoic acid synthase